MGHEDRIRENMARHERAPHHYTLIDTALSIPAIESTPEFPHFHTDYFRLNAEVGTLNQIWRRSPLVRAGYEIGGGAYLTAGGFSNLGSHEVGASGFFGGQLELFGFLILGAQARVSLGYSELQYGRGTTPDPSFDILAGGRVYGGVNLRWPDSHLAFMPHVFLQSLISVAGRETHYDSTLAGFGIRVLWDRTPEPPPPRNTFLLPTCRIEPSLINNQVVLQVTTDGGENENNGLSLRRVNGQSSRSARSEMFDLPVQQNGDHLHQYQFQESIDHIPDSGATYTATVRGWAGSNTCSTPIIGPVQYVPPPPPPPICPSSPPPQLPSPARLLVETPFLFNRGLVRVPLENRRNANLDAVIEYLNEVPNASLQVDGYANEAGPDESRQVQNRALSRQRVEAVVRYLTTHGVSQDRLVYGEQSYHGRRPRTPLITADDSRNRCVSFQIVEAR